MQCINCNKYFEQQAVNQKYCSQRCKKQYYRKTTKEERQEMWITNDSFNCSHCGKLVVKDTTKIDMRTRFCSNACCKKYWKKSR